MQRRALLLLGAESSASKNGPGNSCGKVPNTSYKARGRRSLSTRLHLSVRLHPAHHVFCLVHVFHYRRRLVRVQSSPTSRCCRRCRRRRGRGRGRSRPPAAQNRLLRNSFQKREIAQDGGGWRRVVLTTRDCTARVHRSQSARIAHVAHLRLFQAPCTYPHTDVKPEGKETTVYTKITST